ncbi:hypothetical protein EVA_15468 [gut metagenome]|uniref:Uncharacterized protein n=1 Tax=gut metagenome TaxID=749906 RepID=J9C950_9ZZZZ
MENSTKLTPTKGKKMEAKIEGGENEAVKYGANTYTLEFEIRIGKGRKKPIEDVDGVIDGEYALKLQPEDKTVEGLKIDRSSLSVEETYDTENGTKLKYTVDVLKPETGNQVKFEVINFNGAGSLRVIIADDGGAGMWKLSTEATWHHSGMSVTTKAGSVTIGYKPIAGKKLPSQTSATIKVDETTEINATYTALGV